MPRYIEIDKERLSKLHDGLELMEMLDREAMVSLDLHIYGITNDPQILDAAREAIADDEELTEQDVEVAEVAVAIPLGSDAIYSLAGSGIKLRNEDFAYLGGEGAGIRTLSFTFANFKPVVSLNNFSKVALASSSAWLDNFLQREGSGQAAQVTPAVHRSEEATQPGIPPAPAIPKQTSLSKLLDNFLD
jgi:hypothetical protein